MKNAILCSAVLAAFAAGADVDGLTLDEHEAPETPWKNVTMDVYRNWFGEELPHLEVMDLDHVKPDIVLKLDQPTARNVYGQPQTERVARLAACIIRGTYVPEEDGKIFLTLSENTTKFRLFVDETGRGRTFTEVPLARHPKLSRTELAVPQESSGPAVMKSRRVFTSKEPLAVRKGKPIAFKVHFLPGFYGEGVSLQAVKQN